MPPAFPSVTLVDSIAALREWAAEGSAVSPEAEDTRTQAARCWRNFEQSQALFGAKAEAISQLWNLADEEPTVDQISVAVAERIIRALPSKFPLPEFAVDPDGSISLDWIESRHRMFSVSAGAHSRLAFAWLDGTDRGHGVAQFDGRRIPERVLEGIASITTHRNASLRAA